MLGYESVRPILRTRITLNHFDESPAHPVDTPSSAYSKFCANTGTRCETCDLSPAGCWTNTWTGCILPPTPFLGNVVRISQRDAHPFPAVAITASLDCRMIGWAQTTADCTTKWLRGGRVRLEWLC